MRKKITVAIIYLFLTITFALPSPTRAYSIFGGPLKGNCIDTAIGCIPIEQQEMITFLLRWAIGIAGGVAFILIIIASFQIMTSQGDPKRLQAGKELLSSAIMGLILLIFSAFILRVIGVNILKIPGLS
jgi:hypothetical protein